MCLGGWMVGCCKDRPWDQGSVYRGMVVVGGARVCPRTIAYRRRLVKPLPRSDLVCRGRKRRGREVGVNWDSMIGNLLKRECIA